MIHASLCYQASVFLTKMKFPHPPCRNIRFIFYDLHCTEIEVITKDPEIKAQFWGNRSAMGEMFYFLARITLNRKFKLEQAQSLQNSEKSVKILKDIAFQFVTVPFSIVQCSGQWCLRMNWDFGCARHLVASLFASDPVLSTSRPLVVPHWFTSCI